MMVKTRLAMAIGVVLLVGALCLPPRGAFAQTDQCPEPNEEPPTACPLADGARVHAFMDRSGDVDVYRFDTGSAVRAQLDLTELPADYDLYLTDADNRVIGRSIREGVEIRDERVHFAARAYPGEGGTEPISVVNFRFRRPDGRWDTGCHADTPDGDLYTCSMNVGRVPEGEIKFGFDVLDPRSEVTESPDGFRYLSVDR